MTWMKLDTLVRSNPKLGATVAATGHCDAAWLWLAANTYCRDALTDGFIADFVLPTLIPALPVKVLRPLPDVLVGCGLWHRSEGGYQVHDFLHHNPTKVEVDAKREKERIRKRGGSGADSARNDGGGGADSASRAGEIAGAHTSPSDSFSPGSALVPEGGPGETAPAIVVEGAPPPPRSTVASRAAALGIVQPGKWDRQHGSHALRADFCNWVCFPQAVHDEFVNRLKGTGDAHDVALVAVRRWALGVRGRWAQTTDVPGEDIFKFWRNEWQATHGSNRPSAAPKRGAGLDAILHGGGRG